MKARLHMRFLSEQLDANFVAFKLLSKICTSKPDSILMRFYSVSQGFRTFPQRYGGEKAIKLKSRAWSYNEEVALTYLWQNYPCFFNTSCTDSKRHCKMAAALVALI